MDSDRSQPLSLGIEIPPVWDYNPIVEFALEKDTQPISVSTYQITRELPTPILEEVLRVEIGAG
jgi:hypothetical protein